MGFLKRRYGHRVIVGDDLEIDAYYRWLWRADVQVSTATHESLGVSTLEALAAGNRCLVPRVGAYEEITGGLADVVFDDQADLTTMIDRAIQHLDVSRAIGRVSSAAVRTNYSAEAVASRVMAALM